MDTAELRDFVAAAWKTGGPIVEALSEYIRIPNISPTYDPGWADNGLLDKATEFLADRARNMLAEWGKAGCDCGDVAVRVLGGRDAPILNDGGERRTPIILVDIPARGAAPAETILLYGHLDKQPGLDGQWSEGLGPYSPVVRDGKLYGRGGADDAYSLFASLSAVMGARRLGLPHARCVILVESCEESGSKDLEHYIRSLRSELGDVELVVCLDSGCQTYDRLWITDTLRGLVNGALRVAVSREGVHSGVASGVIPSPFRIMRALLSRLENQDTGELFPPELKVDIPDAAVRAAKRMAEVLGDAIPGQFPFLPGVRPAQEDYAELVLARTWKTQVVVKGMDGLPPRAGSGNVMLPEMTASLSFRLPPTLSSEKAAAFIKATLEKDPPYNAQVSFSVDDIGDGWTAPTPAPWLEKALREGSLAFFGEDAIPVGEGGSIPFMGLLGRVFPKAQFLIAGVLGPGANAHGPDEFLHLAMAEKATLCVARVVADHAAARA